MESFYKLRLMSDTDYQFNIKRLHYDVEMWYDTFRGKFIKVNSLERYRSGHNGAVLKTVRGNSTWVRIPPSPPYYTYNKDSSDLTRVLFCIVGLFNVVSVQVDDLVYMFLSTTLYFE